MCNTSMLPESFNSLIEPFSFSTFQLLSNRNRLLIPCSATDPSAYQKSMKNTQIQSPSEQLLPHSYDVRSPSMSPILDVMESTTSQHLPTIAESKRSSLLQEEIDSNKAQTILKPLGGIPPKVPLNNNIFPLPNINVLPLSGTPTALLNCQPSLPAFDYLTPRVRNISPVDIPLVELNRVGNIFPPFMHRRPRGEKRPIPEEQKDDKYYERRKRNNEAAKKSRDARKIREDRIAFRAAFLEQENSILRAQVIALRDELQTMRQIIGRNHINQL